jgi:zinc transport system substrate-binding protein
MVTLALASCGGGDGREVIAVTILPERRFVSAVVGEDFRVVSLVPPGHSPETYEPTAAVMMDLADAAAYFSIGVPVEENSLLPMLSGDTLHVSLADAAAAVYPDLTINGGRDPHVWLSPKRVRVMIAAILEAAVTLRPDRAEIYRENAAAYLAALDAADARIRSALAESGVTEFIVYHPAFGYLADEYGLTMHALEDEGSEATAVDMAAMVDFARSRNIRVIFYQAETDSRQAEAFAAEIGGRAVMLSPLAEKYVENLEIMAEAIASIRGE